MHTHASRSLDDDNPSFDSLQFPTSQQTNQHSLPYSPGGSSLLVLSRSSFDSPLLLLLLLLQTMVSVSVVHGQATRLIGPTTSRYRHRLLLPMLMIAPAAEVLALGCPS